MDRKKVGIIGAGVSGLATCKHALDKGFSPVVFEADSNIGGVWAHTLESTRLQASTTAFRFSDLAWPASVTETYPSHHKVMEYLRSYACHFGLLKCIKFNSQVLGVEYLGATEEEIMGWERWSGNGTAFGIGKGGEWRLTVKNLKIGCTEVFLVDFLILCIGRHSGNPNIPEFPANKGPELFKGKILHSLDYSYMDYAAEFIRGKHVTIVGSGKSAFDIAAEVAKVNGAARPCTMIYRTKHWLVNKSNIWGLDLSYFYLNRISQLLVHKPGEGFLHCLLATALSPLRWAISKVIETYFKRNTPLQKHGMVPDYSFSFAMTSCLIAILPEGFYDRVEEGSIILKKSKRFSFSKDGIVLEDANEHIESDIVILFSLLSSTRSCHLAHSAPDVSMAPNIAMSSVHLDRANLDVNAEECIGCAAGDSPPVHIELEVRLVRMVKAVLLVYPVYEHVVLSQDEANDVFPRYISPHFAAGQTDGLTPCVGRQSSCQVEELQPHMMQLLAVRI